MTATFSKPRVPLALVEFLRYFVCSALALAADTGVYWLALRLGVAYQGAAVAGFIAGVSTAYVLSVRWAFRRRSLANAHVEFLVFLAIGVAGLGLTEALLWLQIGVFGVGPIVAKLLSAVVVFLFNFVARKLVLFSFRPGTAIRAAA
jgi:putative flippase GtrA